MAHEHLGLFDTSPDRQEIRFGLAVVGVLFVALWLILPLHDIRLGAIDAFVPIIDTIMLVSDLIIATLLYAQASVLRSRALTVLASGYVLTALLLVPHALTFPGAFAEGGLLGAGVNTAAWLAVLRWLAFPIAIILYALCKSADSAAQTATKRTAPRVFGWLSGAVALVALATMLTTTGHDLFPPLFLNHRDGILASLVIVNSVAILFAIAAMATLFRHDKSVLDVWLLVALSAWLFQSLLNLPIRARFTLGWYGLYGMMLAASLTVMLVLVAESNRLYARLAISTSERNREREARMMSMNAVVSAIFHEVGQPITAVALNASAGLRWLDRARPDTERATQSLRNVIDASTRTIDVIESLRTTFTKRTGAVSEFSLNDLAREAASLLDRELVAHKISLQFALDGSLPPILANQVQIKRVLVNLLTNAIESLDATRGRPQRITIRSVPLDGQEVLLEVSDSGDGIAPEKLTRIFEPFFTTKSTGTGLGLSLSRAIAEEHGGRLWATSDEENGATFHVQLPCRPALNH